MSSMTDQMKTVSQNILASKHNRMSAIADFASCTGALLSTYRQERGTAAAEQSRALSSETRELANSVQMMLRIFRQDRIQEAKSQQQAGKEIRASLDADRLGRIHATNILIGEFRNSRDKSAHAQAKELGEFVRGMQIRVNGLIKHAQKSRHEMRRETAKVLQETVGDVRQQTGQIAAHSRGLVKEFQHARIDMGKQLEKHLSACTDARQLEVNRLLDGFGSSQLALRQDLAGVQQAWLASGNATEKHGGHKFGIQERAQPPQTSEVEKVLYMIQEHPEGISASQIGEKMEIDSLLVGHIAKELNDGGKIRRDKKTRLYFPHEAGGKTS